MVQVDQLTAHFDEVQHSANEATDMMEGEQMEKRELEDKLAETMVGVWWVCGGCVVGVWWVCGGGSWS